MKENKSREEYDNSYEWRRDTLHREIYTRDDLEGKYPNVISYFVKSGKTPVSGKVFQPPEPEFKCKCDIKTCFVKIKEKMHTKSGNLRAGMLKLQEYEVQAWSELLEYLRSEWQLGNREEVLLTGKEYMLLFVDNKKKK